MGLSCKDAARLLSERRDRRLPLRTYITLRFHVFACKMCRIYGAQLIAVSRVCREAGIYAEDKCPGELLPTRKQRMKDTIDRSR